MQGVNEKEKQPLQPENSQTNQDVPAFRPPPLRRMNATTNLYDSKSKLVNRIVSVKNCMITTSLS